VRALPASAERRPSAVAPALLTGLVAAAALAARPAIRVQAGASPVAAHLRLPIAYVALAPACDLFDAMSLLSLRQHGALLATALVAYAASRAWRARSALGRPRPGLPAEAAGVGRLVGGLVALYLVGALVPRPMAAIELADPSALAVDFHSHTEASHDGRRGFTAEANRAWHRAAGFDVAYVSDHGTQAAALGAGPRNPAHAGAGTTLLPAVETVCLDEHLVLLGPVPRPAPHMCPEAGRPNAPPAVALFTIPGHPGRLPLLRGVVGAESVDGTPRAFDETPSDRALLHRTAERLDLALVAGSNNHGWGRTAPAWSVMVIPGWRALRPEALDSAIRRRVLVERRRAVVVVERRRLETGPGLVGDLALTAPRLGWRILTTMSAGERVAWVAWAWIAWGLIALARRPRARRRR
jgi:hypothetical protein